MLTTLNTSQDHVVSQHSCDHCSFVQDIFRFLLIHSLNGTSFHGPSRLRTQYTFKEPAIWAPPARPSTLAMMMMNQSIPFWKSILPAISHPTLPENSIRPQSYIFIVDVCAPSPRIYK